jgi:hypothetical protein
VNPGVEVQAKSTASQSTPSSQQLWAIGSSTAFALFWTGTIAAVGLLLDFAALIVRARLVVGEWPHPSSGDPLGGNYVETSIDPKFFAIHSMTIEYAALAVVFLVPVAMFVLLVGAFVARLRQPRWMIASFLIANTIIGVMVFLDPHGFVLWFMD